MPTADAAKALRARIRPGEIVGVFAATLKENPAAYMQMVADFAREYGVEVELMQAYADEVLSRIE